jgi:hypothetical protein
MRTTLILCLFALGCGDDGGGGGGGNADAPSAPAMITVSGVAAEKSATGTTPKAGVMVAAYKNSDPNTAVVTATTDASGNYSLAIPTGGVAVDGYVKATLSGLIDTYLYPPRALTEDFAGASIYMISTGTRDALSGALCGSAQMDSNGAVAVLVQDAAAMPIAGATISSQPAAMKYCYNGGSGLPDKNATGTAADGIGYMLNVAAGDVTVSASKSGTEFFSHKVNARAGALTTTLIEPK